MVLSGPSYTWDKCVRLHLYWGENFPFSFAIVPLQNYDDYRGSSSGRATGGSLIQVHKLVHKEQKILMQINEPGGSQKEFIKSIKY